MSLHADAELDMPERERLKTAMQNLIGAGRETFGLERLAREAGLTEAEVKREMDRQARANGIALEAVREDAWRLDLDEEE